MPPRLRHLATDWKTYLGLLAGGSALLVALTNFIDKLKDILKVLGILAWAAEWAIVGSLSFLALLALWAALTRRSILLRPERFLISAADPCHLVRREERVKQ